MRRNVTLEDPVQFEGYCIDLMEELRVLMGFDYEVVEASDGVYGGMDESMQWNGMIKDLIDKVHLCLVLFKVTAQMYLLRREWILPLAPYLLWQREKTSWTSLCLITIWSASRF